MTLVAERELEHLGETRGCEDHDHDLVHELSKRLDGVWRYDQYHANAVGHPELQEFWRDVKLQEEQTVRRLKELITKEIRQECF